MASEHSGHSHQHPHGHGHAPANVSAGTMGAAVVLTLAFVAAEAASGWFGHSLALLSDADRERLITWPLYMRVGRAR